MPVENYIDARNPVWPTKTVGSSGVAYIATGRRFAEEAQTAAAQLRRTNPQLRICLITDQPDFTPRFWDDLVVVKNPHFGFRDKILMGLCPYERFLYLDGDTYVASDLSDLFRLLENFDFIGHQLFEGNDCPQPEVSNAFLEFNGGVLGFRRTPKLDGFFDRWLGHYDRFYAQNRNGHYHYSNVSDQKSLRLTVYQSALRVGTLGPEYNFTPYHVEFACAPVRIFHGRTPGGFGPFAQRMNEKLGNRAYVPRLDVIVMNEPPARELRRLWVMATLQLLRRAGLCITPLALRDRLRQSSLVRTLFLRNRFSTAESKPDPKWHVPSSNPAVVRSPRPSRGPASHAD